MKFRACKFRFRHVHMRTVQLVTHKHMIRYAISLCLLLSNHFRLKVFTPAGAALHVFAQRVQFVRLEMRPGMAITFFGWRKFKSAHVSELSRMCVCVCLIRQAQAERSTTCLRCINIVKNKFRKNIWHAWCAAALNTHKQELCQFYSVCRNRVSHAHSGKRLGRDTHMVDVCLVVKIFCVFFTDNILSMQHIS